MKIEAQGGQCPYQADGTIEGYPFYFRSRGEAWSFKVLMNKQSSLAYEDWPDGVPTWEYKEWFGKWPSAGYITKEQAASFMKKAAAKFKKRE